MLELDLTEALAALSRSGNRSEAARSTARWLGGEDLLIFCRDAEVNALLPAPGFPQTLPGGLRWKEFIEGCEREREAVLPNPGSSGAGESRWAGYRAGDAILAVQAAEGQLERSRVDSLVAILPVLTEVFHWERKAMRAKDAASSCREAAARTERIASELDHTRRELQLVLSETRRSRQRASFLSEASRRLSLSLDCETTLRECGRILLPALADAGFLFVRDGREFPLTRAFADGIEADVSLSGAIRALITEVRESGKSASAHFEDSRYQLLALPLYWRLELNGVLVALKRTRDGGGLSADRASLLGEFAERLSISLENGFLYRDAQSAIRSREEFLSIASHELKTPLTTILLGHQLIKRKLRRDEVAKSLNQAISPLMESVEEQLKNLGNLINTLLDVSRACQSCVSLERTDFDLSQLVLKIADRFRESAKIAGSRLVTQAQPVRVHCDPLRIGQALNNLITNAIKYGNGSEIEIRVGRDGEFAAVSVRDQGIGISAEDQGRIFNRFERAVNYQQISGLGLGLYITKQIIEAHDGTVRVSSQPGKGSLFEIRIPSPFSVPMTCRQAEA